jgi:stage V sporulation protein AD
MRDFGVHPEEYDAVYTGDLGYYGSALLYELLEEDHLYLRGRHWDCGCMIFSKVEQDTHAGGSGCGCSAVTLAAHVLPRMRRGELRKVLFIPTGALLSPLSCQQGESIPGIAHGIVFEREDSRGRKGA